MALPKSDIILLLITIIIVAIDIILALCLRFVLPDHVTKPNYYPADGKKRDFQTASEYCPCLYGVYPDGYQEDIIFTTTKKPKKKRSLQEDVEDGIEKYPFLVSLSIAAYSDDPIQKIFACNGLVLSSEWLLTTEKCVHDYSEWYNLTVRSESLFWSKLGRLHDVVGFVPGKNKGFMEVKVWPPFSASIVPRRPIEYPSNGKWSYATSIGWNDEMYKQSIEFRHKYKVFEIEKWTSGNYTSNYSQVCYNTNYCNISSKPLLTSCHDLIGIGVTHGNECEGFSRFNMNHNGDAKVLPENECYPIFTDDGLAKDIEICHR